MQKLSCMVPTTLALFFIDVKWNHGNISRASRHIEYHAQWSYATKIMSSMRKMSLSTSHIQKLSCMVVTKLALLLQLSYGIVETSLRHKQTSLALKHIYACTNAQFVHTHIIYDIVKRTTKKHVQTEPSIIMQSFSLECLAQEGRRYQSNHANSAQKAVFSGAHPYHQCLHSQRSNGLILSRLETRIDDIRVTQCLAMHLLLQHNMKCTQIQTTTDTFLHSCSK